MDRKHNVVHLFNACASGWWLEGSVGGGGDLMTLSKQRASMHDTTRLLSKALAHFPNAWGAKEKKNKEEEKEENGKLASVQSKGHAVLSCF